MLIISIDSNCEKGRNLHVDVEKTVYVYLCVYVWFNKIKMDHSQKMLLLNNAYKYIYILIIASNRWKVI